MTRLVLVRHGQTEWHAENRYAGSSDVALTERGVEQAHQLAGWAKTAGLAEIWCSPLSRARRTAEAAAALVDQQVQVDERLRELDFGRGEGLTTVEMRAAFPVELVAFERDPVADHLPGGEDPVACAERFVSCLDDIAARHPDGRVLVVAHTTAIRLALCALFGVALGRYRQLFPFIRNCGITEIRHDSTGTALLEFNSPVDQSEEPHP